MNLLVTGAWQGAKDGIEQLKMLGHQVQFLQFEKMSFRVHMNGLKGLYATDYFFRIRSSDLLI